MLTPRSHFKTDFREGEAPAEPRFVAILARREPRPPSPVEVGTIPRRTLHALGAGLPTPTKLSTAGLPLALGAGLPTPTKLSTAGLPLALGAGLPTPTKLCFSVTNSSDTLLSPRVREP